MPCSPSDPPSIPVARTPRPPVGPSPKAPVPAQRPGLPQLPRPRPSGTTSDLPTAGCAQLFAATPTAAGWARRHTADILARWGVPDLTDDCCLVVSELVGNAVRHAGSDGAPALCRLVLRLLVDAVSVEVWDPSPDADVSVREVDELSESGRGLAIVAALCGAPPVVFAAPGDGKTIVAVVPRTAA